MGVPSSSLEAEASAVAGGGADPPSGGEGGGGGGGGAGAVGGGGGGGGRPGIQGGGWGGGSLTPLPRGRTHPPTPPDRPAPTRATPTTRHQAGSQRLRKRSRGAWPSTRARPCP